MVLVFLIAGILLLLSVVIYLLFLSSVKVNITKLHISRQHSQWRLQIESKISIYLLGILKILQIKLDDQKIKQLYQSGKIDIKKLRAKHPLTMEQIKLMASTPAKVETFHLQGYLGTENAAVSPILSTVINAIVPMLLRNAMGKLSQGKYTCKVETVFFNQNLLNLTLDCIISIKIVHIISTLHQYLKKGGGKNNERTSNRRTYAYSHE